MKTVTIKMPATLYHLVELAADMSNERTVEHYIKAVVIRDIESFDSLVPASQNGEPAGLTPWPPGGAAWGHLRGGTK